MIVQDYCWIGAQVHAARFGSELTALVHPGLFGVGLMLLGLVLGSPYCFLLLGL